MKSEIRNQDLHAEAVMSSLRVRHKVAYCTFKNVDWETSKTNVARLSIPVVQENVEAYAEAYKNGAPFPMPVYLFDKATDKYQILGGMTRSLAAKTAGLDGLWAYVIETDDERTLDLLPRMLNVQIRGVGRTTMLEHAKRAHLVYGCSIKEASRMFNVSPATLAGKLRSEKTRLRLQELKVLVPSTASEAILDALHPLQGNDNVLQAAGRYVFQTGLNSKDTDELVRELGERKTEISKLAFIESRVKEAAELAPIPTKTSTGDLRKKRPSINRSRLLQLLRELKGRLGRETTWALAGITTKALRQEAEELSDEVVRLLKKLVRGDEETRPISGGKAPGRRQMVFQA